MPIRARPRPVHETLDPVRRLRLALLLFGAVVVVGVIGYVALGLSVLDALYQTVTTITTVGFRELGTPTSAYKLFTMVLVLIGVGTALYAATVFLETLIEGRLTDRLWRRRMERDIANLSGHVIVCGFGRVGQTVVGQLANAGRDVVVVDNDPQRFVDVDQRYVVGDATDDDVLDRAGLARAGTIIAVTESDATNLYITLSARAARPDLFIVSRARVASAEGKMRQAGADRVVNPQQIGAGRIVALTLQPHVAEFVDVVMHDGSLEFRLAEVVIPTGSPLAGRTIRDAHIRDRTGAMVLALRDGGGTFNPNPDPDTAIEAGQVLITIGTRDQLAQLTALAGVEA